MGSEQLTELVTLLKSAPNADSVLSALLQSLKAANSGSSRIDPTDHGCTNTSGDGNDSDSTLDENSSFPKDLKGNLEEQNKGNDGNLKFTADDLLSKRSKNGKASEAQQTFRVCTPANLL